MADAGGQTFFFLFRTDKGRIDRATWWKGSVPLVLLTGLATAGWVLLRPYAHHDLAEQQFFAPLTIVAFAYLLAYCFGLILIGVCEYNLSAKRFRARGQPGALAGLLPLSLLFGGAVLWFIPRSFGSVPDWIAPIVLVALALMGIWNVVELGIRADGTVP